MLSKSPLHRFLYADLLEVADPLVTDVGIVVASKGVPRSQLNRAQRMRQEAIRDALTGREPLPDEIRLALLGCFEDLMRGHVPSLFMPVEGRGNHNNYMADTAVEHALVYLASVPTTRQRIARENIARWYQIDDRTLRRWIDEWAKRGDIVVPIRLPQARKNALAWSRAYQVHRSVSRRQDGQRAAGLRIMSPPLRKRR